MCLLLCYIPFVQHSSENEPAMTRFCCVSFSIFVLLYILVTNDQASNPGKANVPFKFTLCHTVCYSSLCHFMISITSFLIDQNMSFQAFYDIVPQYNIQCFKLKYMQFSQLVSQLAYQRCFSLMSRVKTDSAMHMENKSDHTIEVPGSVFTKSLVGVLIYDQFGLLDHNE